MGFTFTRSPPKSEPTIWSPWSWIDFKYVGLHNSLLAIDQLEERCVTPTKLSSTPSFTFQSQEQRLFRHTDRSLRPQTKHKAVYKRLNRSRFSSEIRVPVSFGILAEGFHLFRGFWSLWGEARLSRTTNIRESHKPTPEFASAPSNPFLSWWVEQTRHTKCTQFWFALSPASCLCFRFLPRKSEDDPVIYVAAGSGSSRRCCLCSFAILGIKYLVSWKSAHHYQDSEFIVEKPLTII